MVPNSSPKPVDLFSLTQCLLLSLIHRTSEPRGTRCYWEDPRGKSRRNDKGMGKNSHREKTSHFENWEKS